MFSSLHNFYGLVSLTCTSSPTCAWTTLYCSGTDKEASEKNKNRAHENNSTLGRNLPALFRIFLMRPAIRWRLFILR